MTSSTRKTGGFPSKRYGERRANRTLWLKARAAWNEGYGARFSRYQKDNESGPAEVSFRLTVRPRA